MKQHTHKHPLLTLLLLLAMTLFLVACGGTEPEVAEPTTASEVEEETTPTEEPVVEEEPVEEEAVVEKEAPAEEEMAEEEAVVELVENALNLWVYDDGRLGVLTELGEQFEAEYGIQVAVQVVDLGDIVDQIVLGEGPDMAIVPHDNIGPMVESATIATLDLGDKSGEYLASAVDGFTYGGDLYGLPLAVENIGFFRNTDMVPDAPETWEEVFAIGEGLVNSGDAQLAIGFPDLTYNTYPLYTAFGGYIFGRDANGGFTSDDIGLATDGFVEGLTVAQSFMDSELASTNIDWEASHVLFETGEIPFILTGPWALNRFRTAGVPYAISAFPSAESGGEPGHPFLGVQGIVFNANSDNLLLAQTFALETIATEAGMQAIFDAEPRPSAWESIFTSVDDPDTKGFNDAGINAVPMPSIPAMGYVWEAWGNAGTFVATGELTPADALQAAVDQIEAQIAENE